jgi:hypothetical protein
MEVMMKSGHYHRIDNVWRDLERHHPAYQTFGDLVGLDTAIRNFNHKHQLAHLSHGLRSVAQGARTRGLMPC